MNMNLKLDLDMKKLLPMLKSLQPLLVGGLMIAVFGYTAYIVNAVLNVQPAASGSAGVPRATIKFDKATIESLKKLEVVEGDVPTEGLGGTDNPFN